MDPRFDHSIKLNVAMVCNLKKQKKRSPVNVSSFALGDNMTPFFHELQILAASRLKALFLLLLASTLGLSSAHADYPDHAIKMVVPYPAGGATDVVARAVALKLGDRLKQPVVIENRGGASGQIGADYVAKSAPDGYTVLFTAADTHSINPYVYPKISYDAKKDFSPIAEVGILQMTLVVSPNIKAKNVQEFITLAHQQAGKMSYASYGTGSSSHVAMAMLNVSEKLDILHVPFQGAAPAIAAVMAGQVDAMMVPLTLAYPNHQAGKVRLLGVAAPSRFVSAPDMPTFTEQGYPINATPWLGILGPAKMSASTVEKLNQEVNAVCQDPQIVELLVRNGLAVETKNVTQFKAYLDADSERWGATIRAANIKAE
jgi:tripartite-type tricarboxylate transporter receptor subunit TctC